jgi:hypothetical protein
MPYTDEELTRIAQHVDEMEDPSLGLAIVMGLREAGFDVVRRNDPDTDEQIRVVYDAFNLTETGSRSSVPVGWGRIAKALEALNSHPDVAVLIGRDEWEKRIYEWAYDIGLVAIDATSLTDRILDALFGEEADDDWLQREAASARRTRESGITRRRETGERRPWEEKP